MCRQFGHERRECRNRYSAVLRGSGVTADSEEDRVEGFTEGGDGMVEEEVQKKGIEVDEFEKNVDALFDEELEEMKKKERKSWEAKAAGGPRCSHCMEWGHDIKECEWMEALGGCNEGWQCVVCGELGHMDGACLKGGFAGEESGGRER